MFDNVLSLLFFLDKKSKQKSQGKTMLSSRSVIRQELQPKMDKPLWRNSKPYHIHAGAGPQFCRAIALVLLKFCEINRKLVVFAENFPVPTVARNFQLPIGTGNFRVRNIYFQYKQTLLPPVILRGWRFVNAVCNDSLIAP